MLLDQSIIIRAYTYQYSLENPFSNNATSLLKEWAVILFSCASTVLKVIALLLLLKARVELNDQVAALAMIDSDFDERQV
jgi:hypothetical protein